VFNSLLHQVQEKRMSEFFGHSQAVTAAANALPRIVNSKGFSSANQEIRKTIEDLHFSLYETYEKFEKGFDGKARRVYSFYPIQEEFAEYFNQIDDDANSESISNKVAHSFLNLLRSLDTFIKLGNDLKESKRYEENTILESSIELLTKTLGSLIGPLDDILKDVLDQAIYKGDQLKSLRRQMDKKFVSGGASLRETLHLDRNRDKSLRKKPVDTEKRNRNQQRQATKTKKKKRIDQRKARKAGRRK
jgi:hypothetical protein